MFKKLLRKWGPSGKVIRLAVIIGIILSASGVYYVKASGLLSPGRLTAAPPNNEELGGVMSHADMEKECSHCHAPLHCVTDSRCQDCHIEIAKQRNDVNTLHGRLPGVSRCQNCHIEHQGEQANITQLAFENVDHYLLAGFSLTQHVRNYDDTSFTCPSCHSQNGEILETIDCLTCHSEA